MVGEAKPRAHMLNVRGRGFKRDLRSGRRVVDI